MKKLAVILAILMFSIAASAKKKEGDVLIKGDKLPEFTLTSQKYDDISSKDLEGKVSLIVIFATWCGPCQFELAELERTVYLKFKRKKNFKFIVIGRDHTDAELERYNKTKKFEFPLYPDADQKVSSLFATKFIPRTYLINEEGTIIRTTQGFKKGDIKKLMKDIDKLIFPKN